MSDDDDEKKELVTLLAPAGTGPRHLGGPNSTIPSGKYYDVDGVGLVPYVVRGSDDEAWLIAVENCRPYN